MIEFEPALKSLTAERVDFVIVGGLAISAHSTGYITTDLDFCYLRTRENLKKIVAALAPFKLRFRHLLEDLPFVWDKRTLQNGTNFTLVTTIGDIDLLSEVAGVENDGKMVRRFDVLELERRVVFFPLAWTVVHPIDDKSLLSNLTEADLKKTDAEILILIAATDETFASVVYTRSSYKTSEIKFKHKFVNMYNEVKDGAPLSIDIKKLSQIEKVEE